MSGSGPVARRLRMAAMVGRCVYCRELMSRATWQRFTASSGQVVTVHRWHEVRPGEVRSADERSESGNAEMSVLRMDES